MKAVKLVTRSNVFNFSNITWVQLIGQAMGMPTACIVAMIYFAFHEVTILVPKYQTLLIDLAQFIDSMIILWRGSKADMERFKQDLNSFGIVTWITEEPKRTVNFLDLHISIKNRQLRYNTHQREWNLYQYIPPSSCHPPGLLKSLVFVTLG